MTGAKCVSCGGPVADAYLCWSCTDCGQSKDGRCAYRQPRDPCLTHALGDLPALADDLDVTRTRQSVGGKRTGSRSSTTPLPWDERAAKVAVAMRVEIVALVRSLDPQPVLVGGPVCADCKHESCATYWHDTWPEDNLPAMGWWLFDQRIEIRRRIDADDIYGVVVRVGRSVRYVIDTQPDRWYAGPCGAEHEGVTCVEDLYAAHDAKTVRCRTCGAEHDAEHRKTWLLREASDVLVHAELIGRAAPMLGIDITPAAIRNYAARGMIVAHGKDHQGRPTYRFGDVITVAREALARRAERESRRSA